MFVLRPLSRPVCSEDGFLPPQASDADKDAVTTGWIPAFVERFTTPGELPRAVHTELLNLAEVKALKQEYTQASEPVSEQSGNINRQVGHFIDSANPTRRHRGPAHGGPSVTAGG